MADSFWQGTTDGTTRVYTIPFPFLESSDVIVQLNGVTMLTPGDYIWNGPSSIQFNKVPPSGYTLTISRQTSPDAALVSFNNGAVLTAQDLNTSAEQNFYRTQELQDQLNVYINAGVARYSVTGANPLVTPTDLLDAAADAALQTDLAQTLLNAIGDINTNAESILTNTNQIATLQAALDVLTSGVPGGIGTYLTNETNSRIAGDAALQSTFNLMGAVSGGGATFVLDTANVYVDSLTSMADKFTGLLSQIAGNTAAITSEATTRAAGDSALSTLISGLTSTVGSNTAAIASEATTRAAADSANAASITSLTTTVNGNTASISSQLTSINGLEAQYVLKLDVNGHVAGFGLASGAGGTSNFTIVANTFSMIDPGNGLTTPTVPFTVSSGVVYMQNVVIGGALIEDLTIGTGKIVNDAATEVYSVESPTGSACTTTAGGAPNSNLQSTYATAPAVPWHDDLTTSFTPGASGTLVVTVMGQQRVRINGTVPGGAPQSAMWIVVVNMNTGAVVYQSAASQSRAGTGSFTYQYGSSVWACTVIRGICSVTGGVPYKVYVVDAMPNSVDTSNYVSSALVGSTITCEIIKK